MPHGVRVEESEPRREIKDLKRRKAENEQHRLDDLVRVRPLDVKRKGDPRDAINAPEGHRYRHVVAIVKMDKVEVGAVRDEEGDGHGSDADNHRNATDVEDAENAQNEGEEDGPAELYRGCRETQNQYGGSYNAGFIVAENAHQKTSIARYWQQETIIK